MKNTITHNMEKWFSEAIPAGKNFLYWFETVFENNRMGTFKVPNSVLKRFDGKIEIFFKAIGQSYIELIKKIKPILKSIPFSMLDIEDRKTLREFIGEQIQFSITNKQIFQIINASNISSPTFTINQDTTPWAFTIDMISKRGSNLMQNSELDKYEIVKKSTLFQITKNENIKIINKFDLDKNIPNAIWDEVEEN